MAVVSVVGVLAAELPMSVVVRNVGEAMSANGFISERVNSTQTRFPRSVSTIEPSRWVEEDYTSFRGDPVTIMVTEGCVQALDYIMAFHWSFLVIAVVVYGWDEAREARLISFTTFTSSIHWAITVFADFIHAKGEGSLLIVILYYVVVYPLLLADNLYKFMAPASRWRSTVGPVLITIVSVIVGYESMKILMSHFFKSTSIIFRIIVRGVCLPSIKYVWIHAMLMAIERLPIKHKEDAFVVFTIPISLVTGAGHLMSFASASLLEAAVMEGMSAAGEVMEYYTYLRGQTHIIKIYNRMGWTIDVGKDVVTNKSIQRLTSLTRVAPQDTTTEVNDETPTERADRQRKEQRLRNMTKLAVIMGVVEGASSTMTAGLFLLLPLNPSVVGGEPVPWPYVLKVWGIQICFEVFIPEAMVALMSQWWATPGRFGDVTHALESFDNRRHVLVMAFVSIIFISHIHWCSLNRLCVAARGPNGGGGLLSFSACCPYEAEFNATRYADADEAWRGTCFMDEHYPLTCDGPTGPGEEWAWGEKCVSL